MKICPLSFMSVDMFLSIIYVEDKILGNMGQLIFQSARTLEDS